MTTLVGKVIERYYVLQVFSSSRQEWQSNQYGSLAVIQQELAKVNQDLKEYKVRMVKRTVIEEAVSVNGEQKTVP
jgi:hypothetical protein